MEQVITEFNKAMEESGTRMEKIKNIVMKEAEAMIVSLEDAEARRQEELVMRKNKLIERLTSDLEATGQLEEELRSRGVGGNERKRWTFPPEDPEQKALKVTKCCMSYPSTASVRAKRLRFGILV